MFSDEEPPRKKRRSKWDITPSEPGGSAGSQEASVSTQLAAPSATEPASSVPSSAIAAAAAAKINAMLASQGKLVKSDPPLAKVSPEGGKGGDWMCSLHVYMYLVTEENEILQHS